MRRCVEAQKNPLGGGLVAVWCAALAVGLPQSIGFERFSGLLALPCAL